MSYNTWVKDKFPSIISFRKAKNSLGTVAIYSLKDREFNLVNIIDDILAIYNTIELYDSTLVFDRFYFIFKDTTSGKMKVVTILNNTLYLYTDNKIDFETLEHMIEIRDLTLWSPNERSVG